eukprot:4811252-Pyramimonas_sp.AAC.1
MIVDDPIDDRIEAFPVQDPGPVDMFQLLDSSREARQRLRIWKTTESDVEGCVRLCESKVASPTGARISWPVLS